MSMGYAIVLHLSDADVRATNIDASKLGATLAEAVGTDAYPLGLPGGRRVGPWTVAGPYHSASMVVLRADATGIAAVGAGTIDDSTASAWQAQLTPRAHAAALRDLRSPHKRLAAATTEGSDILEAYFGPDRSATSLGSIWWFYADALRTTSGPASLGPVVASAMGTYDGDAFGLGSHANALNKLGALVADGSVRLVWSGNRLCRPDDLTDPETRRYEDLTGRADVSV